MFGRTILLLYINILNKLSNQYGLTLVLDACEKWLELNLISTLSTSVHLQHLPMFMLEKVGDKIRTDRYCVLARHFCFITRTNASPPSPLPP